MTSQTCVQINKLKAMSGEGKDTHDEKFMVIVCAVELCSFVCRPI